jgi:uncharacterized protein (DUF3084 family)
MEADINDFNKRIKERDGIIVERDSTIQSRDTKVKDLEKEI